MIKWQCWQKPGAFGKMLTWSGRFSKNFEACHATVLRRDQQSWGGVFQKALKQMGAVECRFDCEDKEWEAWCCSLNASALMLCGEVDDRNRSASEKQAAQETLDEVYKPTVITFAGMVGDWELAGRDLVLHLDVDDPDPALGPRLGEEYVKKTTKMFLSLIHI